MISTENHVERNPYVLLNLLKEVSKGNLEKLELPYKDKILIEHTFDSMTVIGGWWINTVEMLKIQSLLEGYNLEQINFIKIEYLMGMTTYNDLRETSHWYEITFVLDSIAGDGITFSHN